MSATHAASARTSSRQRPDDALAYPVADIFMNYCYAPRRQAAFPDVYQTWTATPGQHTAAFLHKVADAGYSRATLQASAG